MVGSSVSASRTITSSSEGPRYLSSSAARAPMRRNARANSARLFIVPQILLYVLIVVKDLLYNYTNNLEGTYQNTFFGKKIKRD